MLGFSSIATLFGVISVTEQNGLIRVSGVPGDYLQDVISSTYRRGGKVVKNIFHDVRRTSFSFYSFFAMEIHLIFKRLEVDATPYRVKRISRKIVEQLEEKTWIKDTISPNIIPMVDMTLIRGFKLTPKPHQMKFLQEYGENVVRYQLRGYLLAASPGTGKGQLYSARVKILGGWKTIHHLQVGDYITAPDGSQTKVVGKYPQGKKPIYRLAFEDGRSIECDDTHLWKIRRDGVWSVIQTIDLLTLDLTEETLIPLVSPECSDEDPQVVFDETLGMCTHWPDGTRRYETPVKDHAESFIQRVRSIGWVPKLISTEGGQYLIHIGPSPEGLRLTSVDYVGIDETCCIAVDHPDRLYITDDFIVTHNTFMDILLAAIVLPREIAEIKIIVAPKNAIDLVWADDLGKYFYDIPTYWSSSEKGPAPTTGVEYYIFHYEALDRALELSKVLLKEKKKYFVILDECHNFNNPDALRTKNLVDLCVRGGAYSIWASGSPIKAMGTEIIPLLRAIDPKFTPEVEQAFRRAFGGDAEYANDLLYDRIGKISFKIPKTDVITDKPINYKRRVKLKDPKPFLISTVREEMKDYITKRVLELKRDMSKYDAMFDECLKFYKTKIRTDAQRRMFDAYVSDVHMLRSNKVTGAAAGEYLARCKIFEKTYLLPALPQAMQRQFKQARSIVKSLLLKVRGEALGRILSRRRAECSAQLALNCGLPDIVNEGLGKTLVYSSYIHALDTGRKYMDQQGYTTIGVYGPAAKEVTRLVTEFTNIEEINPLFATYPALSTAVPVIIANQIVMLDLPARQFLFEQTVARAHRLGQKHKVIVYEVLLDTGNEPNISTRSEEIIEWSRTQVSQLMGEDFGGPESDEYTIERYDPEKAIRSL